jgi:NAD(P)H dehydrogenase (quinone)
LKRDVGYEQIPLKTWEEIIAKNISPFLAQHLVEVAKDHSAGVFSGTNDLVKKLTGKEPIDLREFVERNITAFKSGSVTRKKHDPKKQHRLLGC